MRAAARGPLPGPDPRGEAPGPGRGSPASAFRSRGGPGREAEGAEAGGASAAQPERSAQRRGRETRAILADSAQTAAAPASPWSIPALFHPEAARSRRAANPNQQLQRAGSGERPAQPHGTAAGLRRWNRTNPESSEGRGHAGRGRT